MIREFWIPAALVASIAVVSLVLPSTWRLSPPIGNTATTGTFPQGISLSPDGAKLAIVESGFLPPGLRILAADDLRTLAFLPLKGAFGIPVWIDASHVAVAGAGTNSFLTVDIVARTVSAVPNAGAWPAAIAHSATGTTFAVSDENGSIVYSEGTATATAGKAGFHPSAIALTPSGIYVANRGEASLTKLDTTLHPTAGTPRKTIAVDLHPSALLLSRDGSRLYVACADADAVDVLDTKSDTVIDRIDVGLPQGPGASPNALALAPDGTLYVSLGAENAIAEIVDGRVIARMPAGRYPSGIAADARNVYVSNAHGESSPANPNFEPEMPNPGGLEAIVRNGYVAASVVGSVRKIPRSAFDAASTNEVLANLPDPIPTPDQTVLRAHGPIQHVIYIIKENRSYDQVLGDLPGADGDPNLAFFGATVTPNEHAISKRFGTFDMTFADGEISASGHNWSTAAFANDYLERFWPPNYGGRRKLFDFWDGAVASTPRNGYIWDDADSHGISLRDYGEFCTNPPSHWPTQNLMGFTVSADLGPHPLPSSPVTTQMAGLKGRIDPHYPAFDLQISDELRADEWLHEFDGYERAGNLPQLEIVWLPNDHTELTLPGALTPRAYAALNDHAFARIVDAVSHSPFWKSTAIFAIEDDAQFGPDHVDDQRTTFYLASPYAAPGIHHARYSTSSVVRSIEMLLGLPPMSIFDAVAPPLYDAFTLEPNFTPYNALSEKIDVNARNSASAYGAKTSERLDFHEPDSIDPALARAILMGASRDSQR
jgi:YVTN family beta-propeller protein